MIQLMCTVDIQPPAPSEVGIAHFYRVDLTDYGQVVASFMEHDSLYKGIDAVIHLAALPSPAVAVSQLNPAYGCCIFLGGLKMYSQITSCSIPTSDRRTTSSRPPE